MYRARLPAARTLRAAMWDIARMTLMSPAEWEARGKPEQRFQPLRDRLMPAEWLAGYQANFTSMLRYARQTFPEVSAAGRRALLRCCAAALLPHPVRCLRQAASR